MTLRVRVHHSFLPEKTYVINALLGELLGLAFSIEPDGQPEYRLVLPNGARLVVRDAFWARVGQGEAYLSSHMLPSRAITVASSLSLEGDLPLAYGNDEMAVSDREITLGGDLFASAFFMLTRWEERFLPRDAHGRVRAADSFAGREGLLGRPLVNEYAEFLWRGLTHLQIDQERRARSYRLHPTHDVDVIHYQPVANLRSAVIRQRRLVPTLRRLQLLLGRVNPYDTFDFLMDVSEAAQAQSRFYFLAGGSSPYDVGRYDLADRIIRERCARIRERGHVVGIHPSYSSLLDPDQLGSEVRHFTEVVGMAPREGRQHYLRFAVPDTWNQWQGAGLEVDSTLGFADHEGFRCGTADEYPVFDCVQRRTLNVRERPLVVMDETLASYRDMSLAQADAAIRRLAGTCRKYRMPFTVLFHNDTFDPVTRPGWRSWYARLIPEIA